VNCYIAVDQFLRGRDAADSVWAGAVPPGRQILLINHIPKSPAEHALPAIARILFGLIWLPLCSFGQNAQGTIVGHVSDPAGEPVVHARVTVQNTSTAVKNVVSTNGTGDYVVVNLIPGPYEVSIELPGFQTAQANGLQLQVEQTLRQDVRMQLGQVSQSVHVSASSQMVETDNATIGNVVPGALIEALPINGRDFTNLLSIGAGATNLSGGIQATGYVLHGLNPSFRETSLDGARPDSISYLIDGVTDNDFFFSAPSNVPGENAIAEFKVQNGLYGAQYGQGSAQVNVAIKSGTNQLHGSAYDFLQNEALQPASPITAALNARNGTSFPLKTPFKQNQLGGTLGGPVLIPKLYNGRNKTFWFFGYDGGRQITSSGVQSVQVPTAQERSGNFSDWPYPIYNPLSAGSAPVTTDNPVGRTVFSGNQIPSSLLDPISSKLLAYFPLPNVNCAPPCLNYTAEVRNTKVVNTETMRVDQNWGSADRLFFTGVLSGDDEPNNSILPATGSTSNKNSRLFGIEWQHSFGGNLFNEARVGYNYQFFHSGVETAFGPNLAANLGLNNSPNIPAFYDIPVVNLQNGYTGVGSNAGGYTQLNRVFQIVDDLTWVHGRHTITTGLDIRRVYLYDTDGFVSMGQLNFTGAYTALNPSTAGAASSTGGNSFADLLLGNPFSISAPPPLGSDLYHLRGNNWNFFVEDDIRVNPRFTLNLGLRYEIPTTFHERDNSGYAFNPANGGGLIWANKGFVQSVLASPGVNPNWLQCCVNNQLVPVDKHDFAPRIGIAWRPFHTDRFVIRSGYGIFYDTYNRFYDGSTYDNNSLYTLGPNPNYPTATGLESTSPLALHGLWLPPVNSAGLFSGPAYTFPLTQVNLPGNHTPYNQQWSFDTQFSLAQTLLLDIGYVGSHSIHQPTQLLFGVANQPPVANDNCNFLLDAAQATGGNASCLADPNFVPVDKRQPYPGLSPGLYGNANVLQSTYNSLQVQLIKRLENGLQFHLNYTWSRALDESSAINNAGGQNDFIMDPHNIRQDYGPAGYDQKHRFVASYSYELPVGKGRRWSVPYLNWLVGGWDTSGIYTVASGFPFSVYSIGAYNQDQTGSSFGGRSRANVSGDPLTGFTQTPLQWFNTGVFSSAPEGTYGNSGRGIIRSPYFMNWDASFSKNFAITERQRIQARLEVFNLGSNWHSTSRFPDATVTDSAANCTPGPAGNCAFGSLVSLNGVGSTNLWTPRTLQVSLTYLF